jgi:arginine decarboxylase
MLITGLRIPRKFFITKGVGESPNTHHAGSYHLALCDAGIETQNIMTYSSILPKEAEEIDRPAEALCFGAVMECIISQCDGLKDETLSAGIAYAWLYDDNDNKVGGVVVERSGGHDEESLIEILNNSIYELKNKSFSKLRMEEPNYITQTFVPTEQYGTALVAICFVDHIWPVIND